MAQGYLLYPENYTKEQLCQNYNDAYNAYSDSWNNGDECALYAARAAYYVALATVHDIQLLSSQWYQYYFADYVANAHTSCTKFFEHTGENRQDYIDAIHKENK